MEKAIYNGIELPELPQLNKVHQPRTPYAMIMPDGSVEDANKALRGYIPETEDQ